MAAAQKIDPKISRQDLDDLVSEGYVIALEIIASGDLDEFETLFWTKFKRSVWDSYEYIFDFQHVEDMEVPPLAHAVSVEGPLEKSYREQEFLHTTASVLDFLSPSERRVLCLVLGLTSRGCCGVTETAAILNLSRRAARTLYDRIVSKVHSAIRRESPAGWELLSRGRPGPRSKLPH